MLKIGHRWAAWYLPENTLPSFEKAISLWVDMIELDVYMSKDFKIVVIHDETLHRTTNWMWNVSDFTYEELWQFDAGNGAKIPLLSEVIDLVNKKCNINIELKWNNTAKYVAELIKDYLHIWRKSELFFISSSNEFLLNEFNTILPDIKRGLIYSWIPILYSSIILPTHAEVLCLDREFINQDFIDHAHNNNVKVFVRTVDDKNEIIKLKNMKVDWIISNYPDLI